MREFLRKKDMRKFLYLETTKAGAKTPALSIRHIGICQSVPFAFFIYAIQFSKCSILKSARALR